MLCVMQMLNGRDAMAPWQRVMQICRLVNHAILLSTLISILNKNSSDFFTHSQTISLPYSFIRLYYLHNNYNMW